jgi:hypothetical protein
MNAVLVATALTVVAGAIVAVSSRDGRVALAGLAVVLVASPLLADPVPAPLPLLARILGALLAIELLWIAVRVTGGGTRGSLVGWPVEALVAAAGAVAGVLVSSAVAGSAFTSSAAGPAPAAVGAAFALGALAIVPLVVGRDALRLAVGAALLVAAAIALQAGFLGAPTAFDQLVAAGAIVAVGTAGAALIANAYEARGDLSLTGPARAPAPRKSLHAPPQGSPRAPVPATHGQSSPRPATSAGGRAGR